MWARRGGKFRERRGDGEGGRGRDRESWTKCWRTRKKERPNAGRENSRKSKKGFVYPSGGETVSHFLCFGGSGLISVTSASLARCCQVWCKSLLTGGGKNTGCCIWERSCTVSKCSQAWCGTESERWAYRCSLCVTANFILHVYWDVYPQRQGFWRKSENARFSVLWCSVHILYQTKNISFLGLTKIKINLLIHKNSDGFKYNVSLQTYLLNNNMQ